MHFSTMLCVNLGTAKAIRVEALAVMATMQSRDTATIIMLRAAADSLIDAEVMLSATYGRRAATARDLITRALAELNEQARDDAIADISRASTSNS